MEIANALQDFFSKYRSRGEWHAKSVQKILQPQQMGEPVLSVNLMTYMTKSSKFANPALKALFQLTGL
jgi:hypothetical protein